LATKRRTIMKMFDNLLRLAFCVSVLAIALALSVLTSSSQAADPGPPGGLNVNVVNPPSHPVPVTLQGTGSVTGSVTVTNTATNPVPVNGSVGITGTPTVNVGNFPASAALKPSQLVTLQSFLTSGDNCFGHGVLVDRLANSDATVTPNFSIPSGKVLV